MQLPTQQQFVTNCLAKYRWESIPADQKWEAAHFPLPQCSGEGDTVMLWSADHTVQGLLQSVELDHKCFYWKANGKDLLNLQTYFPEYLELFQQLKSQFARRNGKKCAELKLGIHGRSAEQMTADSKKANAINKANGTGFYDPKIRLAGAKAGGKKIVELGVGVHAPGVRSKGGKTTNAQKWQCLVTDYISTPGGLSRYQKKRGIDTKLRKRVY